MPLRIYSRKIGAVRTVCVGMKRDIAPIVFINYAIIAAVPGNGVVVIGSRVTGTYHEIVPNLYSARCSSGEKDFGFAVSNFP